MNSMSTANRSNGARLTSAPIQKPGGSVTVYVIFDGVRVHKGQILAVIRHNARVLLSCERVILNLMQHLSGIATTVASLPPA